MELIQWLPFVLTTAFLSGIYVQGQREIIRRLEAQDKLINTKVDTVVCDIGHKNLHNEHMRLEAELKRVEGMVIESQHDIKQILKDKND